MFYLFILESIGTSELLLIGLVALIVFGPRKLPEIAKTLGKAMNEFRRSTDDFKKAWEKEVEFENNNQSKLISSEEGSIPTENSIQRNANEVSDKIVSPNIREIKREDFQESFPDKEIQNLKKREIETTNKQDWL